MLQLSDIIDMGATRSLRMLALDPGETTGFAFWNKGSFERTGQIQLSIADIDMFLGRFVPFEQQWAPRYLVVEDYRVYQSKAESHINSTLFTPRLIGALEHAASQRIIQVYKQMAAQVKPFVTDDKLMAWGLYAEGQPHRNDAVRHGIYFMIRYFPLNRMPANPVAYPFKSPVAALIQEKKIAFDAMSGTILQAIDSLGGTARPNDLISQVRETTKADEATILTTIWQLVDIKRLHLTSDLRFTLHEVTDEYDEAR